MNFEKNTGHFTLDVTEIRQRPQFSQYQILVEMFGKVSSEGGIQTQSPWSIQYMVQDRPPLAKLGIGRERGNCSPTRRSPRWARSPQRLPSSLGAHIQNTRVRNFTLRVRDSMLGILAAWFTDLSARIHQPGDFFGYLKG
jgi:hypothetical protein